MTKIRYQIMLSNRARSIVEEYCFKKRHLENFSQQVHHYILDTYDKLERRVGKEIWYEQKIEEYINRIKQLEYEFKEVKKNGS